MKDKALVRGRYHVKGMGPALVREEHVPLVEEALAKVSGMAWDEELRAERKLPLALYDALKGVAPVNDWVEKPPEELWDAVIDNIIVDEGLNHMLDVELGADTQITTWYMGLLAASPSPLAGWTATEIASNDFVNYTESTLPSMSFGSASSKSISASAVNFSINQNGSSIGGGFVISTSAKGTPAGTLFSAGAFSLGNKAADNGDTLQVTYTATTADDGV